MSTSIPKFYINVLDNAPTAFHARSSLVNYLRRYCKVTVKQARDYVYAYFEMNSHRVRMYYGGPYINGIPLLSESIDYGD